jgi:hypothetical protein
LPSMGRSWPLALLSVLTNIESASSSSSEQLPTAACPWRANALDLTAVSGNDAPALAPSDAAQTEEEGRGSGSGGEAWAAGSAQGDSR